MTHPDLSNSVQEELARRVASPCLHHWCGLQEVLRYLAETSNLALRFTKGANIDDGRLLVGCLDSE